LPSNEGDSRTAERTSAALIRTNAYGTGSSREKRQASNDACISKVEKVLCPTISELFISTIFF
jgi:hypothetical protein